MTVADLLVRGVDEEWVRALKARAGANDRSAEAEHREILKAALVGPRRRSFAEILATMPNVGVDADFERVSGHGDLGRVLIDTNVISERRREAKTNNGVAQFFRDAAADNQLIYISAISTGELRRGVELIRHRGDATQADRLEAWLSTIFDQFNEKILPFDA